MVSLVFVIKKSLVLNSQASKLSPWSPELFFRNGGYPAVLDFRNTNIKNSWNGGARFGNRKEETAVTLGVKCDYSSHTACFFGWNFSSNRKWIGSEITGRNAGLVRL